MPGRPSQHTAAAKERCRQLLLLGHSRGSAARIAGVDWMTANRIAGQLKAQKKPAASAEFVRCRGCGARVKAERPCLNCQVQHHADGYRPDRREAEP